VLIASSVSHARIKGVKLALIAVFAPSHVNGTWEAKAFVAVHTAFSGSHRFTSPTEVSGATLLNYPGLFAEA
jgi:hypothetical protein